MTTVDTAARVVMMHQGGWDEIALFTGPVAIIGLLVFLARRQVPPPDEDDDEVS
ncbi:hypothetical protein MUY14_15040 [Amycolatopsis sp. FBCC-B4732]|uniref:hypothetical protein n=1 Tax=Amycolatopsis sp. FBCC-B4732 TaxID=3079339 RepID=UPI001FF40C54|nr:hypothetical protein [Amycolatopsis sp. FBCC-B4732]UOX91876.1 hypothetical protein MUY14_15040 [Amycolatopsis sp. FBCC-B4732]